MEGDELLDSQIAYYRAHAPKYDDWWFRNNRHDLGEEFRSRWESNIGAVRSALHRCAPLGAVLEFAGGTGNWTRELTQLGDSVLVVDASPEAVAIAREKVTGNVTWDLQDIFGYQPYRRYDTVFFGFWLSHVPLDRFEDFWAIVDASLAPGGRVFFIDNAHPQHGRDVVPAIFDSSADGRIIDGIDSATDLATGVSTRKAADGNTYEVVKIWWEPAELQARLDRLGWDFEVAATEWAFIYGQGSRRSS